MKLPDIPRKKIEYDDDLVIVYSEEDGCVYKGIEDYEPMNDEDWKWDSKLQAYKVTLYNETYYKICLDVI